MTTPQAFRDLATVIEGFDAAEIFVDGVRTNEERSADEGSLTAELTARIPWDASTDLDGAVSFSLPDGTDVDATGPELTVPLRVEIGAGADREADGGDALGAATDESADAAKTQVTDGGVRAPVKTDGAASPATGRSDRASEPRDESRSESEEEAQIETGNAAAEAERVAVESTDEDADASTSSDENADADGEDANGESAVGESADDEPATPPHRDPERLREVYESHETFAEMTEALGASVTPQTVRNQMIRRGIHEPNRRRDSGAEDEGEATERGAADGESASESNEETADRDGSNDGESTAETAPPERSDDDADREERAEREEREERTDREPAAGSDEEPGEIDLPSHVTLDDVREAVVEATTLYEVQRELRTDRTKTRKLLQQLDLLDLVTGRIATADGRKGAVDEIDERIRRACA